MAIGDAVVSPLVLGALLERLIPPRTRAGQAGADASRCGSPDAAQECTAREVELLAILAEGATNEEIAKRLFISEATVRTHLQHLRKKLGARSCSFAPTNSGSPLAHRPERATVPGHN